MPWLVVRNFLALVVHKRLVLPLVENKRFVLVASSRPVPLAGNFLALGLVGHKLAFALEVVAHKPGMRKRPWQPLVVKCQRSPQVSDTENNRSRQRRHTVRRNKRTF